MLPTLRANVRRNTPFGASSREFTAGTGRLSTVADAKRPDETVRMTTWPAVDDRHVTHRTPGEELVDALDFLLWLLTGHIRRH